MVAGTARRIISPAVSNTSLSLACHLIAYSQFIAKSHELNLPIAGNVQYLVLISISLVLSVFVVFLRKDSHLLFVLGVKFFILTIIGLPMGQFLGIKLSLITSLILDVSCFVSFPKNEVFSFLAAAAFVLTRRFLEAKPISIHDLLSLSLYCSVLVVLGCLAQRRRVLIDKQRETSTQQDHAIDELIAANTGFQHYANVIEKKAKVDERSQITREIHDTIGHALTNIIMMVKAALALRDSGNDKLVKLLTQVQKQADLAHVEMRRTLHVLRSIDEKELLGLKAITQTANVFEEATGIHVAVEYGNFPWTFGSLIDSTLVRFVQEGLTNAHRHGKATRIDIYLWVDDSSIFVTIQDNGVGAGEIHEGIGILGMKERIGLLNGDLHYTSEAGGFQISARIPLETAERHA